MPREPEPRASLLESDPTPDAVMSVGDADTLADLPTRPGVLELVDAAGSCVLIATTRNIRDWVRRRLTGSEAESQARRVELRGVVGSVRAFVSASSLECDALYLRLARARLPHAHRVVVERWRPWFVHVDPDADFPEWSKTNLIGVAQVRSASSGRNKSVGGMQPGNLLGPIPDKDAAGRLIELAQDGFDLCRYHSLLVQAPAAQACAYKEMGRCPAPCDGSETLGDYRRRVREACDGIDAASRARVHRELTDRMALAAEDHDFESAARCKRALDRLGELGKPAFTHVTRLGVWRMLVLSPAPNPGRVRVLFFDQLRLTVLMDVFAADPEAAARVVLTELDRRIGESADDPELDEASQDAAAVMSRWLHRPAKKRDGVAIPCQTQPDAGVVAKAIRSIGKTGLANESAAIDDQEIESVG